jgi:hypothetical protein
MSSLLAVLGVFQDVDSEGASVNFIRDNKLHPSGSMPLIESASLHLRLNGFDTKSSVTECDPL